MRFISSGIRGVRGVEQKTSRTRLGRRCPPPSAILQASRGERGEVGKTWQEEPGGRGRSDGHGKNFWGRKGKVFFKVA